MHQPVHKTFVAGAAIGAYKIVKFGADDNTVVLAAASTDLLIGVTNQVGPALGERLDVIYNGIGEVTLGGTVTRGQKLTSDASGNAIAAAPAAGANAQIVGVAMQSGVSLDVVEVLLSQGVMQG